MFEVGFTELLVIFVLALIVLGPEKLPRVAQQVGRWIGRARAMAKQFREQLEDEVNIVDMKKWEQTSQPPPRSETSDPPPSTSTSPPASDAPSAESTTESSAAESSTDPGASSGHNSGPPPEPEAAVYQPPAYASQPDSEPAQATESSTAGTPAGSPANGTTSVYQTASNDDNAAGERPARPGDVITTTHERGI